MRLQMTFKTEFFEYLEHFRGARPILELHKNPRTESIIGLRHDVDHNIDIALEAAFLEKEIGISASYYLLHTNEYWQDPLFINKCLQLQDYGHEIGLHLNVLTEWMQCRIADPADRLSELLGFLRAGGLEVDGVAAHGDSLCYERGFINYWCFKELRPPDPAKSEHMRTAEGIYDPSGLRGVPYPEDEVLRRADGAVFPLWSLSLADYDLSYHAWHVPFDRYFTDSGGAWIRSGDPMAENLRSERAQILMHPIHWVGPRRVYFFLSTARSGSKWLSELLAAATPLTVRHEYVLNQDFFAGRSKTKRTGHGFASLAENRPEAQVLIADAWKQIDQTIGDYAEVNVYLEAFVEEISWLYPDATLIHVHRKPSDVVRSLMNREWYDTPLDDQHRRVGGVDWNRLGQFEKICHYVADTNLRLLDSCAFRLSFEEMTTDPQYLAEKLKQLSILLHPHLAEPFFGRVINASGRDEFPPFERWTDPEKRFYEDTCGGIARQLGYEGDAPIGAESDINLTASRSSTGWLSGILQSMRRQRDDSVLERPRVLSKGPVTAIGARSWGAKFALIRQESTAGTGVSVRFQRESGNPHITFGGSKWHCAGNGLTGRTGWPVPSGIFVEGSLRLEIGGQGRILVYGLSYGGDGRRLYQRSLALMRPGQDKCHFGFVPRGDTRRIDIALYVSRDNAPVECQVMEFDLCLRPLADRFTDHRGQDIG